MANTRFFYDNEADSADAIAANTEATGFDVEHTQNDFLQVTYRSTGTTATITWDFGAATAMTGGVIDGHNISASVGTFQWRGSTDNFAASDVLVASPTRYSGPIITTWGSVSYRYWRMTVTDATLSYIEIGRIFLGTYYEVAADWAPGHTRGYDDLSIIQESLNGVRGAVIRPMRRVESFAFPILTYAELLLWRTMWEAVGVNKPFFVQLDPDTYPSTWSMFCSFAADLQFPNVFLLTYTQPVSLIEEL